MNIKEPEKKFAFIGFSQNDLNYAIKLAEDLMEFEIQVSLNIGPDYSFSHFDSSKFGYKYCIVLLSQYSTTSESFIGNISQVLNSKIIGLKIANCEIPESLNNIPTIDFENDYEKGIQKLIKSFKTILWVDDSPDNNISARNLFESNGYNFVISLNTNDALEKLQTKKYVAVISDMGRDEGPEEGYVLLEKIREFDEEIPYFIHAGSNSIEHKEMTFNRGGQGTSNIPAELYSMVSNHIKIIDLIDENFETKYRFLDLGSFGLTDLTNIKISLSKLTHLESLNLGPGYYEYGMWKGSYNTNNDNYFLTIPKFIPFHIKFLYISGVGIRYISNLENFRNLELLDLSNNRINQINNLQNLENLTSLALYQNSIYKIENLNELLKIENLELDRNNIEKIEGLESLRNLNRLTLSNNKIREIENINLNLRLQTLDLANNLISKIGKISNLIILENLNLGSNQITKIENLDNLTKIKHLFLNDNQIRKIENLENLKLIESLDLSLNNLVEIKILKLFTKLKNLSLKRNNISKIEPLINLKSLKFIDIDQNPIIDVPADIWQSNDIIQIKAYFNSIQKKGESHTKKPSTKDVKLILLGNSNVGKTNLVHYLETGEFLSERKSTHGLEVRRWKPDTARFPLLANINVSIWDFGGQEYYHDAYKLFLSANAVYIILWEKNTDKNSIQATFLGDKTEEIEHFEKQYWLETVKNTSENAESTPLYIIQNKVDFPRKTIERLNQELFDNYGIRESHHISVKEGCDKTSENYLLQSRILQNFERELELILLEKAGQAENDDNWEAIKNEIIKYQDGESDYFTNFDVRCDCYIDYDDFIEVSQQISNTELSQEELHTLPRWLDACGVIVYFPNNEKLRDKVFIHPKKLSEQIYQILGLNILELNGEFKRENLSKNGADPNFIETFIETTLNLGLIFPHPDTKIDSFLAPQYFPKKHPIEDLFKIASNNIWKDSYIVKLPIFYYKKLLNHLILYFIKDPSTETRFYWKYGIILLKNDIRILIKGLYPEDIKENTNTEKEKRDGEKIIISVQDGVEKANVIKEIFKIIFEFNMEKSSKPVISENLDKLTSKMGSATEPKIGDANFLSKLYISNNDINYYTYKSLNEIKDLSDIKQIPKNQLSLYSSLFYNTNLKKPKRVFVSYSHRNTNWLDKLRVHFSGLKRSNLIEDWTDKEIMAGEMWDEKIKENMESANIFICLLSADFIASEYIWNTELSAIFKKLKDKNAKIIFVYLEPFDLGSIKEAKINDDISNASILDFELIPKENNYLKPISIWANENEALAEVAKKIRAVIEEDLITT